MRTTRRRKLPAIGVLAVCGALAFLGTTAVQADEAIDGKTVYLQYCAVCHGVDAKGNGPMAEVLKPTASDLTLISRWNQGEFPYDRVYDLIDGKAEKMGHGTGQMPIWGEAFSRGLDDHTPYARIMELVFYLKGIQTK